MTDMIGTTISHYKILSKLGEGGMGVVYKAEDTKLKRTVALKFLPPYLTRDPEAKKRFINEAQAASALQHHNVSTIHEINETEDGQMFICMDCYEGETLNDKIRKGPLKVEEAIGIAIQIAEGLKIAHKKGIVHRDIKPANIFITQDGVVKILDFGLAKLTGSMQLTKTSTTLGTVFYMSPEQVRGEKVDYRTDIWSLGVILYEVLTGKVPFKGDYEASVIYSVLNEEPISLKEQRNDIPAELVQIVVRALKKDPKVRYSNTGEIAQALRKLESGRNLEPTGGSIRERLKRMNHKKIVCIAGLVIFILVVLSRLLFLVKNARIDSIAVLPFRISSSNPELEYIADGMAREISNRLAQLPSLKKVISSTTMKEYEGKDVDARIVAREVRVQSVLFSDIILFGDKVAINLELKNGNDNSTIWGQRHESSVSSLYEVEASLTGLIVNHLGIRLDEDEIKHLTKHYTVNDEAYRAYQLGRFFSTKHNREGYIQSIEFYQKAIELDPQYALAYCGLAFSYNELVRLSWIDTDWGYRKAKNELQKALQLDHRLGEAYAVLGTIKLVHDWDIPASKAYLMQALHFSPNSVHVLRMLANYYVWTGSYEKGIQTAKQAIELDPFTPMINMLVPFAYFYANRYEESISQLQNVLSLEPNFIWAHIYLAHNYTMKGMSAEAVKHLDWVESQNSSFLPFVAFDYARSGNPEKAREIIEMIQAYPKEQSVDPITMASIYAGLGEKEKAFEWLGKGYQSRSGLMVYLKAYSRTFLKEINTDVRYKTLLKKIGFSK